MHPDLLAQSIRWKIDYEGEECVFAKSSSTRSCVSTYLGLAQAEAEERRMKEGVEEVVSYE